MTENLLTTIDQPLDPKNDLVLFDEVNGVGIITLNRPQALNALNYEMICKIKHQFETWTNDPKIEMMIIKSNSARAFCAGGDLKDVYQAIKNNNAQFLQDFFGTQYKLDYLIHTSQKPIVTFVNGIIMGGGMGLSMHTQLRIFSETITAAMPEVSIGFFPDVGATYYLNRAPNHFGHYLGLTGLPVESTTALLMDFATHIVPYENHETLCSLLINAPNKSIAELTSIIETYQIKVDIRSIEENLNKIIDLFLLKSVPDIMAALQKSDNIIAKQALELLTMRCPLSLFITHQQLNFNNCNDIRKVMNFEYNLSQYMCQSLDFSEGIRAAVIDKDKKPYWQKNINFEQFDLEKIYVYPDLISSGQ